MSRPQVLYPWPSYRKPLVLDVSAAVDGRGLEVRWIDVPHRRISVVAAHSGWRELDLRLRLDADEPEPVGVGRDRLTAHAVLTASGSVTRIPVALEPDGDGWAGHLVVGRDEVSGVATLSAMLTEDAEGMSARVVGTSEDWTVVLDRLPGPIGRGLSPLQIVWTSFGSAPEGRPTLLKELRSALSFCDTSHADPVLYLNEDVTDLRSLLENEKATGLPGVTRDSLGALIAMDAVAALVDAAVAAVRAAAEPDDEQVAVFAGLDNPVHEAVLEELVDHVDFAVNYHDLCTIICRADQADDPNEIVQLSSRLRAASQSMVAARKHTEDLVRKVLND